MEKNIFFKRYKGSVQDIINAKASRLGTLEQKLAYYIDKIYDESNGSKDVYFNNYQQGIGLIRRNK